MEIMSEGLFASSSGVDFARLQLWSMAGPATYAKPRSWHTGWDLERRYRAADRYPVLWLFDPAAPRLVTSPPVVAFADAPTKVRGRQTPSGARRALLGAEVPRLYNAMSFMNWRYGVMFNCHVVLTFKLMGFADHGTPISFMAAWNSGDETVVGGRAGQTEGALEEAGAGRRRVRTSLGLLRRART